ncbi:ComEC/Rec2 family competence protein [Patescibacteria group bacterium]|nr:ComEC/Rec2 family competence protein [Patescibacteria group bacterium]
MRLRFISLFFLLFLCLYFFRLTQTPRYFIPEGKPVKIVGRVTNQPYLNNSYQIIELGPVLILANRFPGYFYGDKVEVFGKFQGEVINSFKSQYMSFFPTIRLLKEEESLVGKTNFKKFLLKTRGQVEEKIKRLLPEPQSSLLLGVVLGVKSQMPEDFWQDLRKTGTLHLVVASGQNVVMVVGFLMNISVWFLKRRWAILMAILGVVVYVLMVGAEAPAVRAGLMATMIFVGQLLGREVNPGKFLLLTAMVMLLMGPLTLFDIGFQLSFAATAGIIWLYPILSRKALVVGGIPILGEGLLVTLSAQLATLPILLVNFGQFSWLSPLVNALVLPLIPLLMVFGFVIAGLSFFSSFLAQLLSWFVWPFLSWFVRVVEFFGSLSWANWEMGEISFWWAILYYLILLIFLIKIGFNQNERIGSS